MRVKKFAVAALFTAAVTGVVGGVAHAEPTPATPDQITTFQPKAADGSFQPKTASGTEQGVGYTISQSTDGNSLVATLTGGTFKVADGTLTVTDQVGKVIASTPVDLKLDDGTVNLQPSIDRDGTRLTAAPIGHWVTSSPRERNIGAGVGIGVFLGALPAGIIGVAIAIGSMGLLIPLAILALPLGAIIGGAIGGAIGASIPASDKPDMRTWTRDCFNNGYYTYCW
ncbi:hypothetical protein [Nocardia sp. NPDC052566]|uniref:hypothetical protein n=1 Tax=Nocardia sp. NPDC052566 TaxID=3364330 RepID=UPI0037CAB700